MQNGHFELIFDRLSDIAVFDDFKNCQKRRLSYFAVLEVDIVSSFGGTLYFERHFLLQSHLLPHTCCNRMQKPSYPERIRGFISSFHAIRTEAPSVRSNVMFATPNLGP